MTPVYVRWPVRGASVLPSADVLHGKIVIMRPNGCEPVRSPGEVPGEEDAMHAKNEEGAMHAKNEGTIRYLLSAGAWAHVCIHTCWLPTYTYIYVYIYYVYIYICIYVYIYIYICIYMYSHIHEKTSTQKRHADEQFLPNKIRKNAAIRPHIINTHTFTTSRCSRHNNPNRNF
jgi:hypothetical protein